MYDLIRPYANGGAKVYTSRNIYKCFASKKVNKVKVNSTNILTHTHKYNKVFFDKNDDEDEDSQGYGLKVSKSFNRFQKVSKTMTKNVNINKTTSLQV